MLALNADTFESVALDKALDVFVMFVGGGLCKLCDDFFPVFVKAAKVFSRTSNLRFATINMGANELEDATVYYYPTVRMYPRDSKHRPFDYD